MGFPSSMSTLCERDGKRNIHYPSYYNREAAHFLASRISWKIGACVFVVQCVAPSKMRNTVDGLACDLLYAADNSIS